MDEERSGLEESEHESDGIETIDERAEGELGYGTGCESLNVAVCFLEGVDGRCQCRQREDMVAIARQRGMEGRRQGRTSRRKSTVFAYSLFADE